VVVEKTEEAAAGKLSIFSGGVLQTGRTHGDEIKIEEIGAVAATFDVVA